MNKNMQQQQNETTEQRKQNSFAIADGIGRYFNTILIAVVAYFLKVEFEEMKQKLEAIMKVVPLYEYRLINVESGLKEMNDQFERTYFVKPDEIRLKDRKQ